MIHNSQEKETRKVLELPKRYKIYFFFLLAHMTPDLCILRELKVVVTVGKYFKARLSLLSLLSLPLQMNETSKN